MFVFPALVTPVIAIGLLLILIAIPVAMIFFVLWHVRKLNSIDVSLREILEKLKNNSSMH